MPNFRALFDGGAKLKIPGGGYMNAFHADLSTGEFEMAKVLLGGGTEFENRTFYTP